MSPRNMITYILLSKIINKVKITANKMNNHINFTNNEIRIPTKLANYRENINKVGKIQRECQQSWQNTTRMPTKLLQLPTLPCL